MNRILINSAAAINIAAAALIYIACSGDDGAAGPAGPACVASASATTPGGIDISCPGSPVVTLPPGAPGNPGQGGQEGCYLQPAATTGAFDVICGTANVGTIGGPGGGGSGCAVSTTQGDAYFTFTCPGNVTYRLAKAVCNFTGSGGGSKPYDPDVQMCDVVNGVQSGCDGVALDLETQFCRKVTASATSRVPHTRCGPDYLKKTDGTDSTDADNKKIVDPTKNGEYDPETQFCKTASILSGPTNSGFLNGEIASFCGTSTKYTSGDFCFESKLYALCSPAAGPPIVTGVYNPTTHFCQTSTGAAQIPGAAVTGGTVKPRCGSSTPLGVLGKGSYAQTDFCYPATGGAGSTARPKCNDKSGTPAAAIGTLPAGEYNVTTHYCELKITTAYTATGPVAADYSATVKPLSGSVCGTTTYDPTLYDCTATVLTLLCGATYDQTEQVCDPRSITPPSNIATTDLNALAVNDIITATGGDLYYFDTFGSQVWMTEDLNYTIGSTPPYDWATATEACPDGWSLPTNAQWTALIATVNTASGANTPALLLRTGSNDWTSNNPTSTNASGFDATPITQATAAKTAFEGSLDLDATPGIAGIPTIGTLTGDYAAWWTKDEDTANAVVGTDKNNAIIRWFKDNDVVVRTGSGSKLANKLAVRCVKD